MLQQAFYIVQSHDALYDSADEEADEYVHADLSMSCRSLTRVLSATLTRLHEEQRLRILERISVQPPLPPLTSRPKQPQQQPRRYEDEYDAQSTYDSEEDAEQEQERIYARRERAAAIAVDTYGSDSERGYGDSVPLDAERPS